MGALNGELIAIKEALQRSASIDMKNDPSGGTYMMSDASGLIVVMPSITHKLGLLDASVVQKIVEVCAILREFHVLVIAVSGEIEAPHGCRIFKIPAEDYKIMQNAEANVIERIDDLLSDLSKFY